MIERKQNTLLLVLILILIIVLLGTPFYVKKNLSVGEYISAVWRIPKLLEENQSLRLQLEDMRLLDQSGSDGPASLTPNNPYVIAKVYSLHPFNTKNRMYINKGSQDGIRKGSAVLASETVFIGWIENVSANRSEVLTLYDTSFALPVRVGTQETDALLQGGIAPRLTLIDKSKQISSNDRIVTASKDMPYGLEIGFAQDVSEDASGAFFQASISVPYNINALRTVYVLRD